MTGPDDAPKTGSEKEQETVKPSELEQGPKEGAEQNALPGDEPQEQEAESSEDAMPLTSHLNELRRRLTRIIIAMFVGFLACYAFKEELFEYMMLPLLNALKPVNGHLQFTSPPEAFFTYLKTAFVAGIFLTSPYSFAQFWKFIAPGLYAEERRFLIPVAFFSAIFFVGGACFGYFVVFPFAFEFFASFSSDIIEMTPKVSECFSFSLKLLIAFGVVFELPLVIFFMARMGMVTHKALRKFQKYSILLSFVLSAILTPPDVVSQVLMAGPLLLLYEISIHVARIFGKKKKTEDDEDEDTADEPAKA